MNTKLRKYFFNSIESNVAMKHRWQVTNKTWTEKNAETIGLDQ